MYFHCSSPTWSIRHCQHDIGLPNIAIVLFDDFLDERFFSISIIPPHGIEESEPSGERAFYFSTPPVAVLVRALIYWTTKVNRFHTWQDHLS